MAEGARRVFPDAEIVPIPIADGGDGTVEALVAALNGEVRPAKVRGPLGDPVVAEYGLADGGGLAVIEMASAAGLRLIPVNRRNPCTTTTYGVGELMQRAYEAGARRFVIGIGGSATNDAGAGLAQALGFRLLDEQGQDLPPGGAALTRLRRIDASDIRADWSRAEVQVACDVTNPLTGPDGASAVYGPQKGATPEMVAELDRALARFAEVVRKDLRIDVERMPGAGAAGGLGAGLVAFTGARLRRGAEMVAEVLHLPERLKGADLVVTGEGRIDRQTARFGKGPAIVARHAHQLGIAVIAIGGELADEAELRDHFDALEVAVSGPSDLDQLMREAGVQLARASERALRLLQLGGRLPVA
jgi:glycerate kinase